MHSATESDRHVGLDKQRLLIEVRIFGLLRSSLRIPCISRGGTSSRLPGVDEHLKSFGERVSMMLEERLTHQEHNRMWQLRGGR